MRRGLRAAIVVALAGALTLTGCAEQTSLGGYGPLEALEAVDQFPPDQRQAPVEFSGITETGDEWRSDDHLGDVVIVNFWYAGCPPCRIEADDLELALDRLEGEDVTMIGVNVEDSAATVQTFQREFDVSYPSILDAEGAAVRLAFAGSIAPNAIPTTLVLDREGRVAARLLGAIDGSESTLRTLVDDVLAETS